MALQYPQPTGWFVYALNVLLVVTFAAGGWAVLRRLGLTRAWPRKSWWATGSFLWASAAAHVELASIAFFRHEYLVGPAGTAPWWVIATLGAKWISLCFCLWYMVVPDGQKEDEPDAPTPNENA